MRYFYLLNKDEKGSITLHGPHTVVGYERVVDDKYLVTFARCSERDRFNKKKARLICDGRLRKGKFIETEVPEGMDRYEHFINLAKANEQKIQNTREELGIKR